MAGKSDFAQKLLHDLKLRKERMASTHYSSSRDFTGNTSKTYQEARKTQSASRTTCNNNTSRKLNTNIIESSSSKNQIVLFEKGSKNGSSPQKVEDLSMAIAFAFENNGNISKIGVHSSNPLVNFFNRFTRRSSRNNKKLEVASVNGNNSNKHGVTTYELSNVSNIRIDEISKGIQKLNQILSACSNGDSSVEVGKELLKGAMDLEESLKMLANVQESSDSVNRGGQKSDRIRLLEEDEDDDREIYSSKKQVDRPRFSFDKPKNKPNHKLPYHEDMPKQSGNDFKVVPHKRSTSCVPEFNAFNSSMKEKGKISNVIAKLMGLEEMPRNEDEKNSKKNYSSLERKEKEVKKNSSLERKENNVSSKKSDGFNDMFNGNNKIIAKSEIWAVNKSNEKSEKRPQRSSNRTDLGKNKVITDTTDGKDEQKALIDDAVKDERVLRKINEEKRKGTMHDVTRNKQMAHNKTGPHHVQSLEKSKVSEDKNDNAKQKVKQSHQKHNLVERKRKENQIESMIIKQDSLNLKKKKKQNRDKLAQVNTKSADPCEETALKDPIITEISEKTASDKGKVIKQYHNLISVTIEESKDDEQVSKRVSLEKHADDRSATKKNAIIQKNENLRKIDVLLARRNEAVINHSTRSSKHSANMLQDLKERMNKKNLNKKRIEQQNQENIGEVADNVAMSDSVKEVIKEGTNQKDDEETLLKDDSVTDDKACDDLESLNQPYASMDERELKEQDNNSGDHNETALKKRQEPLTDLEKDFKGIIIKDQLFLNTAEALYKLNLPVTFLQDHDHQNKEVSDKKILLDCGYEVMKRKAIRQEYSLHPSKRGVINPSNVRTLDDLVKQLCKDFDMLKVYGGETNDEQDIANCLYKMLDKDILGKYPDVNCMWDHKWNMMKTMFYEMEDVVRDVEKHMINGLLDEITHDFVPVIPAV